MVNVNILSLNVDGVRESPNLDINSIPFDNPDLYVEFTQEDARPINTISLVNIPSYRQLGTYTLNPHRTAQNIITNIYVISDSLTFSLCANPILLLSLLTSFVFLFLFCLL